MKWIVVVLVLFGLGTDAQLVAGTGRVKITPELPMWLSGYAGREKPATEVLQDLWAKVLVIEDGAHLPASRSNGGKNRVVIVTTDLLGISHEVSADVARQVDSLYGIKREQLILNSSHTHSGPMVWPCVDIIFDFTLDQQRQVSLYSQQLTANLVKAIGMALADRAPAELYSGKGEAGFAINRRNKLAPGGPVDHDVPVVKVVRTGKPPVILFGYACHNTTLVENNFLINGDYAGFAQAALEEENPGVTCMFLMGCGGDQNPDPRGTVELAKAHGRELADAVDTVLKGGKMRLVRAPIRTAYTTVDLPYRSFDVAEYEREIVGEDKYLQRRARLMLSAYNRGFTPDHLVYPVQAVRFGADLCVLALSGETVVDYSLKTKRSFAAENLYVAGYSSEVMCYIPSQRLLNEGGYEPDESMIYYGFPGPFANSVEDSVTKAIRFVMKKVGAREGGIPKTRGQIPIRLITLDPGHFHAALVQKSGYPGIDTTVYVYAPPGQELKAHLALIEKYNTRSEEPTHWNEVVYSGPDFLSRMFQDRAGNVVVLAGNNKHKMDYIEQSMDSGFNVLSDKPMIIEGRDLPRLERAFAKARQKGTVLYDIMTERYQITTILQRRFSTIAAVFGKLVKGTVDDPAVTKESVHHFLKSVSGKPLIRPSWYFDVTQEGEGIVDVTTHLVDLVQWECFPDMALDYHKDIRMLAARRWPTVLSQAQYGKVTGSEGLPDSPLSVYSNGVMDYTIKGVHARVSVRWDFEAPPGGGDTHFSVLRGTLANLVIRQDSAHGYKPVLSVEPLRITEQYEKTLQRVIAGLQSDYPGLSLQKTAKGWEVVVAPRFELDHEATFAEVTRKYLGFVKTGRMPVWEVPNMLAKYYTTTAALELARRGQR
jgi:predicted dehydrogenase